jgi:hypothetical protein
LAILLKYLILRTRERKIEKEKERKRERGKETKIGTYNVCLHFLCKKE